jgi:hypothetical protein
MTPAAPPPTVEPGRLSTWTLRGVVYGGFTVGVALVVSAVRSDDPPSWWWTVGIPLTILCGALVSVWVSMRLRFRSRDERMAYIAGLANERTEIGRPLDRSRHAYRATRRKKAVLRSGMDATAIVTFLADGRRANEFRQLVYLELEVTPPDGGEPYQVKTGEFVTAASAGSLAPGSDLWVKVDPADPLQVAVDWEQTLRLR